MYKSGYSALGSGVTGATISYGATFAGPPASVVANIAYTGASDHLILQASLTTKTSTSCIFEFNGATDSTDYVINWQASDANGQDTSIPSKPVNRLAVAPSVAGSDYVPVYSTSGGASVTYRAELDLIKDYISLTDTVASVNGLTGAVVLTKSSVGLADVDNTTDLNKPISTLTQAALDLKENTQTPASQVEAEGGTATGIRSFSPLRVMQAVQAGVAAIGVSTFNGSTGNVTGVGSFNGLTGTVTGVGSVNGATGAVTVVSSFNGLTGTVTGVSSVNSATGAVTVVSSFNGLTGTVTGVSSVNSATGDVTVVSSFNGSTGTVTGVSSFNGSTGTVTGVGSFNGSTGAVTGVSSVNSATGAVTVVSSFNSATGAIEGVNSFNGNTGAVTGVGSVNGATGAVTVVSSFNGLTGTVTGVGSFNGTTGAVVGVGSFNGNTGTVTGVDSVNGETGAVSVAGLIVRGSGNLRGYTSDTAAAEAPAVLVITSSVPSIDTEFEITIITESETQLLIAGAVDPLVPGAEFMNSGAWGDSAACSSAIAGAINSASIASVSAVGGQGGGGECHVTHAGTGITAYLGATSGSGTGTFDGSISGGGSGVAIVPASGDTSEVELIAQSGTKKLRPIAAGIYSGATGLGDASQLALKVSGVYYPIGSNFATGTTGGNVAVNSYFAEWVSGRASASLVARFPTTPVDGSTATFWAVAERVN